VQPLQVIAMFDELLGSALSATPDGWPGLMGTVVGWVDDGSGPEVVGQTRLTMAFAEERVSGGEATPPPRGAGGGSAPWPQSRLAQSCSQERKCLEVCVPEG